MQEMHECPRVPLAGLAARNQAGAGKGGKRRRGSIGAGVRAEGTRCELDLERGLRAQGRVTEGHIELGGEPLSGRLHVVGSAECGAEGRV